MYCNTLLKNGNYCTKKAKYNGYCHIHKNHYENDLLENIKKTVKELHNKILKSIN